MSVRSHWEFDANDAAAIVEDAGIDLNPITHYYTPVTLFPRSVTPAHGGAPDLNLSKIPSMFYVHTPVCTAACSFCPFYFERGQSVSDAYVDAVISQIDHVKSIAQLPSSFSVFFGGGSPNLLSVSQIEKILSQFDWGETQEATIELHPEVMHKPGFLNALPALGITRVSFGLQSVEQIVLQKTARRHGIDELPALLEQVRKLGLSNNVDMLFGGLYRETMAGAQETFRTAFGVLNPDWVSAYQICIQDDTPDVLRYQREPSNFLPLKDILRLRGFRQEIAEEEGYDYCGGDFFAQKHNPLYQSKRWNGRCAVVGIGAGTHSYIVDEDVSRADIWYSPFNTDAYLHSVESGNLPIERFAQLPPEHAKSWGIISELRRMGEAKARLGYEGHLNALTRKGLLVQSGDAYRLSSIGVLLEDLTYASLMPSALWEQLRAQRSKPMPRGERRFDWFFDPDTVLQFNAYLTQ